MMRADKRKAYQINQLMAKHNVDPDLEPKLAKEEDFEHKSFNPKEVEALQALAKSPKKKQLKQTLQAQGLLATREHREQPGPSYNQATEDSFQKVVEEMKKIRTQYFKLEELIWAACKAVGGVRPKGLMAALENLCQQQKMKNLEARVKFLLTKTEKLKSKLKE